MVLGNAEYINWAVPHTYFGMLIRTDPGSRCTDWSLADSLEGWQWIGNTTARSRGEFQARSGVTVRLEQCPRTTKSEGLRFNHLVYVPGITDSLGSAFNFGRRKRVQNLTRYTLSIPVTKPLLGMKQLLFIAYAARIKASPRTHDIKESMLHSNLGHDLPSENASRMFKQMEQPMNQKPPQLGFEQRSSKQPRICMNATAPSLPLTWSPPWGCALSNAWRKAEPRLTLPPQVPPCSTSNWRKQSGTLLKSEVAQGAHGSSIKRGSLRLLLMCAHWHRLLRTIKPTEALCLLCYSWDCRSWLSKARGAPGWGQPRRKRQVFTALPNPLFSKAWSIAPLLSFPSVFSRPGPVLVKYLCHP